MSHIITAGCSFTNCGMSWPYHIENQNVYNVGTVGAGNGYISRAAIWQCEDILRRGVDTEDIFLIVMWSGVDRFEVLSSNKSPLHKDYISGGKNRWWLSNYNRDIHESESVWLKSSIPYMQWDNMAVRGLFDKYWKYLYSEQESFLKTLEYILRVQNYCEVKNIKYKFCSWQNIFNQYYFEVPSGYERNGQKLSGHETWIMDWFDKEHWTPNRYWPEELNQKISKDTPLFKDIYPQTTHLWDMIDFDKFWFYEDEQVEYGGLAEWVLLGAKHNMGMENDPAHPSEDSHKKFTKEIVLDWINND
jgi:hypothetical protein